MNSFRTCTRCIYCSSVHIHILASWPSMPLINDTSNSLLSILLKNILHALNSHLNQVLTWLNLFSHNLLPTSYLNSNVMYLLLEINFSIMEEKMGRESVGICRPVFCPSVGRSISIFVLFFGGVIKIDFANVIFVGSYKYI